MMGFVCFVLVGCALLFIFLLFCCCCCCSCFVCLFHVVVVCFLFVCFVEVLDTKLNPMLAYASEI